MRAITVSDVHAVMQSEQGWQAFFSVMEAMKTYRSALIKTTDEHLLPDLGKPGFPSKESHEFRIEQQTQAQFEVMAAMADFINSVVAASGGRTDGRP